MKIGDFRELAARNLRESMLRNSLTTLGIAVGMASLVAMLSLGIGLQQLIGRRLERTGLFDTVVVRPRSGGANGRGRNRDSRPACRNGARTPAPPPCTGPLDEVARQKLAQLPHVVEVYPELRFTGDIRFVPEGHVTQIASLPPSASAATPSTACKGTSFLRPRRTK